MGKSNVKIDFVVTWVDGSDPRWRSGMLKAREVYKNYLAGLDENSENRYRDMGTLKYWFRGVEKFAPWVNKVFFVTCGQKPEWLNENHPKLVLVNHEEYIPHEWLPTFNSNAIELNFHRIPELSEQFVLFNDDMFLLRLLSPEFFFKESVPVLPCNLNVSRHFRYNSQGRLMFNMSAIINEHFNVLSSMRNNSCKWFNVRKLGAKLALRNYLCFKLNKFMPVWHYGHLPLPHLKSTFSEVWNAYHDVMEETCKIPFRIERGGVNHWLLAGWNMAGGHFYPSGMKERGEWIHLDGEEDNIHQICEAIRNQRVSQLCINDAVLNHDPKMCFSKIQQAFECILSEKSAFER